MGVLLPSAAGSGVALPAFPFFSFSSSRCFFHASRRSRLRRCFSSSADGGGAALPASNPSRRGAAVPVVTAGPREADRLRSLPRDSGDRLRATPAGAGDPWAPCLSSPLGRARSLLRLRLLYRSSRRRRSSSYRAGLSLSLDLSLRRSLSPSSYLPRSLSLSLSRGLRRSDDLSRCRSLLSESRYDSEWRSRSCARSRYSRSSGRLALLSRDGFSYLEEEGLFSSSSSRCDDFLCALRGSGERERGMIWASDSVLNRRGDCLFDGRLIGNRVRKGN
jgi:hypothetical protein